MITSKPFTIRSNCYRAAKAFVERKDNDFTIAHVGIELTADGYVYKIEEPADEAAGEAAGQRTAPYDVTTGQPVEVAGAAAAAPEAATETAPETSPAVIVETVGEGEILGGLAAEILGDMHATQAVAESDKAVAAAAEAAAAPVIVTGDTLLCIAFPAATAIMWAGKLSKQLKMQVTVRNGETLEVLQVVEARKVKATRVKAEGGAPRVGGAAEKMVKLLSADGGATVTELQKAAGWNTKPSSFYLKKLAAARGLPLVVGKSGKEQTFAFGERIAA